MQNLQSSQTPVVFKGNLPLVGVVIWIIAIIPTLAFFLVEPITLGWFESLHLITRVPNNDYTVGRFIAAGLVLVAGIVTSVLTKKIEVSGEGVKVPDGRKIRWEDVRIVQAKAGDVLEISSSIGNQTIGRKDFRIRTLSRFLQHIVDQHPEIRLIDELGWLRQERQKDNRWHRSSRFSAATLYTAFAGAFVLILGVTYFGCWVRPSGVPSDLSFVVTKIGVPKKLGWWESQGYYGQFDLDRYRLVEGTSYTGDLDSTNIKVILFDPNIWAFQLGDTCHVEVAKTAMMASLFVAGNGYYIKNVLSQSRGHQAPGNAVAR